MRKLFFGTSVLLLVFINHACQESDKGEWIKISGYTQGTTYNITYQSPDNTNYQKELEELLGKFDLSLSTYIETSLISRFNQGEKLLTADKFLLTCFNEASDVYKATDGAFDITVAPVVNAWGFGFTEKSEITPSLIDSLKQYVGMEKVSITSGNIIEKHIEGVMLDMNAIAQGYSVDVLCEYLDSLEILNYLVEIGGELRTKGHNPKEMDWKVGIDRPVEGLQVPGVDLQAIVELSERSLATSGNYRKYYEQDGMKYSHTINPKTGYPVQHGMLSATILADNCMRADAYATAFMVMGFEKSRQFLLEQSALDAYLIYNDKKGEYRIWYTDGMKKILIKGD